MLKHSLLQPQMFLNTWFPQLAFPFTSCHCADYFAARSTWLAHVRTLLFFFFFHPRSTKHKDCWVTATAVRHVGSTTILMVLKRLQELMVCCSFGFILRSCCNRAALHQHSHIPTTTIIVCIACLRWFVFCAVHSASYSAPRFGKQSIISFSICHKDHSDASSNCRRQQHMPTCAH